MKDNQHEQLFTELTPAEAAGVDGGGVFLDYLDFDKSESTRTFTNVKSGGVIELATDTYNDPYFASNPTFNATLKNLTTGKTYPRELKVGKATAKWTNIRGGSDKYVINFTDRDDNIYVVGTAAVSYS
jgi:hypothetical protein